MVEEEVHRLLALEVTDVVAAPGMEEDEILALAASLVRDQDSVLGDAVVSEAERRGIDVRDSDFGTRGVGMGSLGMVEGRTVAVIEPGFGDDIGSDPHELVQVAEEMEARDQVVACVILDGTLAGLVGMSHPRLEASILPS